MAFLWAFSSGMDEGSHEGFFSVKHLKSGFQALDSMQILFRRQRSKNVKAVNILRCWLVRPVTSDGKVASSSLVVPANNRGVSWFWIAPFCGLFISLTLSPALSNKISLYLTYSKSVLGQPPTNEGVEEGALAGAAMTSEDFSLRSKWQIKRFWPPLRVCHFDRREKSRGPFPSTPLLNFKIDSLLGERVRVRG